MSETQDIFESHQGAPVTSQSYKELGQKIHQCSEPEREALFASFQPKQLHLQLLKLTVARTNGYDRPLLDALKEESKLISEFSLKSKALYRGRNPELFKPKVLLPILQTVSATTRNRIIFNLGKYVSTGRDTKVTVSDMDMLYSSVSKVWGSNVAIPLLCQTSRGVLERELPNVTSLTKGQLLVVAGKFPTLALAFLEQASTTDPPREAARYVVRKTVPKSFNYLVKQDSSFLTKPMMKMILKNYNDIILESPTIWSGVLDKRTVKKVLRPEHFERFVAKLFMEHKEEGFAYYYTAGFSYFEMLSPSEVSSVLNKAFPEKYGVPLRSKLDFWETNQGLLKLLDAEDRSFIAAALTAKDPLSTDWLPLMTIDLSIPRIKKLLSTEQVARARSTLVSQLFETCALNRDQRTLEETCTFVLTRYRNDKPILRCFFDCEIKFAELSAETFDLVFAVADKYYNPDDWQTQSAAKLFPVAIRRNWGESGLKQYLDHLMKNSPYFSTSDLENLDNELQIVCVEEVFSTANVGNVDRLRELATFLPLISRWSKKSQSPLITDNVKKCVMTLLEKDIDRYLANEFVCTNLKTLDLEFVEGCFKIAPGPKLMAYLVRKKSNLLSNEEELKRIGKYMVEEGVRRFVTLLTKLKKLGYTDLLHHLANESKVALASTYTEKLGRYTNAVVLLMLTSPANDFFSEMDPLLPSADNNKADKSQVGGDGGIQGRYCPLSASKREDAVYYGLGMSISHLEIPALAVERMRRFCVSGDLILFVRDALYSVSGSLPNEKAKTFLLSLMRQPVSVKKHALRLLWRAVCNIETQEVLLLKLMESEEHLTMRIILMNTAFSALNICKSSSMWQVVKQMITKLTPDDKTIVLDIVNKTVPDPFLEEFYKIVLAKCKTLKEVETTRVIESVLQQISYVTSKLSESFIESLISEYFFSSLLLDSDVYCHLSISEICLGYLRGAATTELPANRRPDAVEPRRDLIGRQQFLKERLDACAVDGPRDVFDPKEGVYRVRRMLTSFVERLCDLCLPRHPETETEKSYAHPPTEYLDFLLSYLDQFGRNSVAYPYVVLSLTKILHANASGTPSVVGRKLAAWSIQMFLKSSVSLFCYFPAAVSHFFASSPRFTGSQLVDVLSGMIENVQPGCGSEDTPPDKFNMLLLLTVAHILPSEWLVAEEYKDFRPTFLALVKNTPVEVFLFNAR